jgi:hypothetical protein
MDTERQLPPLRPHCAQLMRFTPLVPGVGAMPELYSYYCARCGEAVTQVAEPGARRDLLSYFTIDRTAYQAN